MLIEKLYLKDKTVAVVTGEEKVITDAQSALDLIMTARYETGTNLIAVDKEAITEDFFVLSRGLAGEEISPNTPASRSRTSFMRVIRARISFLFPPRQKRWSG